MLIQCPACQARAKLPDNKEGAKVRCGDCGRVFVATPPGSRAPTRESSMQPGLVIGVGAVVVLLGLFLLMRRPRDEAPKPTPREEPAAATEPMQMADEMGWEAEPVQAAVGIHEAIFQLDADRLRGLLFGPGIFAAEQLEPAEPAGTEVKAVRDEFVLLDAASKEEHYARWVEGLLEGEQLELLGNWRPYDGRVLERDAKSATVRIDVTQREPADGTKRTIDWKLVQDGARWRAWHWERWLSAAELAALRKAKPKGYEKVTLSDGSIVYERQPEPLEHLEDTPAELREEIDRLYATMLDLDLTTQASKAQARLAEIGRPAIPILLTGLYETPLDTEENAIKCNLVVQTLRRITGQYFGYKPQALQGSGLGTRGETSELDQAVVRLVVQEGSPFHGEGGRGRARGNDRADREGEALAGAPRGVTHQHGVQPLPQHVKPDGIPNRQVLPMRSGIQGARLLRAQPGALQGLQGRGASRSASGG